MRLPAVIGFLLLVSTPALADTLDARRRALATLNQRETALTQRLGADRNALARLLGALQLFSRDPPPPLLVSPSNAQDAVRAMILARAIAPELQVRARALSVEASALAQVRRQAAEASGDLFSAESAIADRQGRLDAVARDADLLAPPSARQAAVDAQAPPTRLIAPADGAIATGFGGRLSNGLIAQGIAYRTGAGAVVRSPAAAVVAYAGALDDWGQVVILRAGGGYHMVLSGLGRVMVSPGQSVAAGVQIGAMPAIGRGPGELYLEVRLAGGPVDPASLMVEAPGSKGSGRGVNFNAAGLRLRREGVD